jgi:hypothetical protein
VEFELSCLCLALEKVSYDVPTVNVHKGEVRAALDTLDSQLIELLYLLPKIDQGPFTYDTGLNYYFSILMALGVWVGGSEGD